MENKTEHKTTTTDEKNSRRGAATTALAVVGFIVLILIGIALAIWAARYVPVALDRLGLAAVSISSDYEPADGSEDEPGLDVIEPGTEIPFEPVATTTPAEPAAPAAPTAPATGYQPTTPAPVPPRPVTVPVYVPPPAPYGKADLAVEITAVGYCTSDNPSSFRTSRDVPDDENGGFRFSVRNAGTNVSGDWDFTYELPTSPSLERTVSNQRSLKPGDRIEYTLCFTEPRSGSDRDISIEVDSDDDVDESNERNNTDSAEIDIDD